MKRILIAIILLGWQLTASAQQQNKSPEQRAQNFSARLSKDLSLSEDQKNKIYNIALSNFTDMQNEKAAGTGNPQAKHGELKSIREKFDNEVRVALTPEQAIAWDKLKADRKAKKVQSNN